MYSSTFINVNAGLNLEDRVWYAPQSDTTFTDGATSFIPGELVDYIGELDLVSGCHATSRTVKSDPAPLSCVRPEGARHSKGKGTVTAVGANYIVVKARRIDYAGCTAINYGGYAAAPAAGDRVEWEGFVEPDGNSMARTLTVN